jgi:BlaI family transcriptional regulator, penicillinase repressor
MKRGLRNLTRRERQIMDVIYRDGKASATDVLEKLPDPPGYSAVRATLRILEQKGHLRHVADGNRYLYLPTVPAERARRSALRNLLQTFFEGSPEKAVAVLLDMSREELAPDELDRLAQLINQAREEGR